jgi:hypothetical protein
MCEDLGEWGIFDGSDDLQGAAALGAAFHIESAGNPVGNIGRRSRVHALQL